MKITFIILLVILAVLACGCTATAPAVPATPVTPEVITMNALPSLIGNWTGPLKGYDEGTGFTDYPNLTISLTVTEQRDRFFAGYLVFKYKNGGEDSSDVAGVISRDGRTLTMVEKGGGYNTGMILSKDELELTYANADTPYGIAVDSFKRV
jgi:hypothetical protein